jgi:hypothetical protein
MLVIYDDNGAVLQSIMAGDFEALEAIYREKGHKVLAVDHIDDPERLYVVNDKLLVRPVVSVGGEIRTVAADGVDTLHFVTYPVSYSLKVWLGNTVVHEESATTGVLDFSTTEPGIYTLMFEAAFPYFRTILTLEAK